MKLGNRSSKNTTAIWAIIVIIFGIISGLAVWKLTDREVLINDPDSPKTEVKKPTKTTEKNKDSTEKPAETLMLSLALPGASPIPARTEDYSADTSLWRLVNKTHPFNDLGYRPNIGVVDVPTQPGRGSDERSLRVDIFPDLRQLFSSAKAAGFSLEVGSGYRSYATQSALFSRYSSDYGEAKASTFSARPGYSEHQSGLAVDIATSDLYCWLETCFGDTAAGKWLENHADEYGFILRYPPGKEGIIDFQYEPWHFRYVGRELAGALKQSGMTLDQAWPYIESLRGELINQGKI